MGGNERATQPPRRRPKSPPPPLLTTLAPTGTEIPWKDGEPFITDKLRVPGSARDGYGAGTSDFTNAILLQLADQFLYLLLTSGHLQGDRSAGHIDSVGSEEVTKFDDFSVILHRAIDLHQR